jgi:hypothetical protein
MNSSTNEYKDWQLGKRLAEALGLKKIPGDSEKYKTSWGIKSPIGLARAIKAFLKD